ncbi:MAG: DUF3040 domain-containing protein [Propionibacteriaceae bacterium]|nr:DUF3040 domain-containing protein [Propionibacteriaceae bacterium]
MALTDAERKLLAELEETLTAQDPKFASKLAQPHHRIHPAKAVGGVLGFLVGLVALIVGMSSYWWISVVGFVVMLVSAIVVMSAWSTMTGEGKSKSSSGPAAEPKEGFMSRLEKRWQDRQDQ